MGCKLHIPDDCELLKTLTVYGYDTSHPFRVRVESMLQSLSQKTVQLQQQEQLLLQQLEQTRIQLAHIRGSKDMARSLSGRWANPLDAGVGQELPLKDRKVPQVVQLSDGQTQDVQAVLQQVGAQIGGQVG